MIVTEELPEWEDSLGMGEISLKYSILIESRCTFVLIQVYVKNNLTLV